MGGFYNRFGIHRVVGTDLEIDSGTLSVDEANDRVGVGTTSPKTKLTVEGAITLKEQADADADTGDYGQLWVNTATPNELYFTTDAGNDISITTGTTLNVTDLHTAGVDGSANQLLTDDGADLRRHNPLGKHRCHSHNEPHNSRFGH